MYCLYVLECADGTLYTGVTNDLKRRVGEHNCGRKGAKYTFARRPVRLVYSKKLSNRGAALTEEARVKKLPRRGKLLLINANRKSAEQVSRSADFKIYL